MHTVSRKFAFARLMSVVFLLVGPLLGPVRPPTPVASAQPEGPEIDVAMEEPPPPEPQRLPNGASPQAITADTYWTTEVVDPGSGVGLFSSLVIDPSDDLHAGYYETTGATLRYAVFTDTAWVTTTVDAVADVGQYASIALDSSDKPRISYYDATNTALRYARKEAGWIESQVDNTASVGQHASLAFDGTTPLISYYDATSSTLKLAWYDNSPSVRDWISETVDAGPGVGQYTAIDVAHYPHIVYYDAGNDRLNYVRDTLAGWDFSDGPVNHAGEGGRFTSLILDSSINPHVSYFSASDEVVYAYHDGTAWSNTVIASAGSEATMHTAIAVDADDVPHIAYTDNVGSGHLYYAYLDGSTWVTETIESATVEGYPSIALDSGGLPHITYQSSTGLKHAWIPPDLIVTDIWDDGGQIWYQVQNVGQGTAPADHQVALTVDGSSSGTDTISVDLAPGERYAGVVTTTWTCSDVYDTLILTADSGGVVVESDETNNTREETWNCDTTAPTITWGPTATSVTTTSAVIEWGTDEDSDSYVYYDPSFIDYSTYEFEDGVYVTTHTLQLTGLEPGTVYRYLVESRDPDNDKTVTSGESFFETEALPSDPPSGAITVTRSSGDYPSYDVVVEVDTPATRALDPVVDQVMLHMDDVLVGTAYVPSRRTGSKSRYSFTISPNRLGLARDDFFVDPGDQVHDLEATVVSPDWTEVVSETFGPPREEIPVDVTLLTPINNWVYYADEFGDLPSGTTIQVAAEAIQYEWECEYVSFRGSDPYAMPPDCGDVAQQMNQVALYVDGVLTGTSSSPAFDFTHILEYNAENLDVGWHTFQVLAVDKDGNWRPSNLRTIIIEQGDPTLSVERTITRLGNSFEVELDISLADEAVGPVLLDSVVDHTDELMPVPHETLTYTLSLEYPDYLGAGERRAEITMDFASGGNDWIYLSPGGSYQVTYEVVPILYEDGLANPRIGTTPLRVYYTYDGEYRNMTFELPWQSLPLLQNAIRSSDYILVTNPDRLHDLYVEDEVHSLLGTMAHLATVRDGVLGFLETYVGTYADGSDDVLRELTDDGYWANALHSDFRDGLDGDGQEGYMLIVGETEVVPAFDTHNFDICWSIPDDDLHCRVGDNDVYHHDHWYAQTEGNDKPDLIVGRIIGDSAWQLMHPLTASIGVAEGYDYYFAPGNALLVSGRGNQMGVFRANIDDIEPILDNWSVESVDLPETGAEALLNTTIADGDFSLWHLMGHGSIDSFGEALYTGAPPEFPGYRPFVFSVACLTGDYEAANDYNLAESLFDQGVSTFIGSTQVSPIDTNDEMSVSFYKDRWNWMGGEPLARALAQTERAFYTDWSYYDWYRFWTFEYNFYGDPKFGASGLAPGARSVAEATAAPTTTLHVQVPDYVVTTTVDGLDQVEIPGGRTFFEEGMHEIPYWTISVDYAPGYRVQDVTLDLRGGYAFTTGLELPTAVMTYYTDVEFTSGEGPTETLDLTEDDDWLPLLDNIYDWDVTLNPDGSSELGIQIFPFHYQPATTNVEWYDAFTFTVDVISTTIDIDGFEVGQGIYEPGAVVTGDLWFENPGDAQDLILAATVRDAVTGDVVDSLTLDALHDVAGANTYNVEWDSVGIDTGRYVLWIDLLDSEGQWLDSASEMFRLGAPFAEIAAFSATPGLFQPGDGIDISMTISNTGSSAVSGEAIIKVFATGVSTPTVVFSQTVTDLAPGNPFVFNEVWDTAAVTEEEYRVIGYLKYDARTTEVETAVVSTRTHIYLPLVLRE